MRSIYLDQFAWVHLSRARLGLPQDRDVTSARSALLTAIKSGSVVTPLSHVHYRETWRIGDAGRRGRLSTEMATLSQFVTVAPVWQLRGAEFDRALNCLFGRPACCRTVSVFGTGAAHAFGTPELQPSTTHLTREQIFLAEWAVLAELEGRDRFVDHERGRYSDEERFSRSETSASRAMKNWRVSAKERTQRFRIQAMADSERELVHGLMAAGISIEEFQALGSDGLEALVCETPSVFVVAELRRLRYANSEQGFQRTDLNDLRALAVAVPYCDAVVADKAWASVLRRSGVLEKYGTKVFTNVADAVSSLET